MAGVLRLLSCSIPVHFDGGCVFYLRGQAVSMAPVEWDANSGEDHQRADGREGLSGLICWWLNFNSDSIFKSFQFSLIGNGQKLLF